MSTNTKAAEMLEQVNSAISAVLAGGQSYKIGSRSLTRSPRISAVCVVSITRRWRMARRRLSPLYSRGFLRVWKASAINPCLWVI